jgi:hypothetical protein
MSSLPIQKHYVGFEGLTAVVMKGLQRRVARQTTRPYTPDDSTIQN